MLCGADKDTVGRRGRGMTQRGRGADIWYMNPATYGGAPKTFCFSTDGAPNDRTAHRGRCHLVGLNAMASLNEDQLLERPRGRARA
jgi:hypothetical protein